jgi:hypothetical protein
MGDELGRKVLVMPPNTDGLRGPHQRLAVEAEAKLLSAAIADTLDRIALFNRDGQPVLLFDGTLHVVNSQKLGWVLHGYFATMHVVERGGRLEIEYRGVRTNELVLRHMLTAEGKYGGLVDKLPVLVIERPQVMTAPTAAPEQPQSCLPEVQAEMLTGARQVARYADAGRQRELEMARGREVVARHAARQVKAETPAVVEESIPVFAPAEANDGAVDPARPQQA